MSRLQSIYEELEREATKLKDRYELYHNGLEIEHQRNHRRIVSPPKKIVKRPKYWEQDKKFNPYYVLDHIKPIARSIEKKLDNGTYQPHDPYIHSIPKSDGTYRSVNVFQIPDAAVSNHTYKRLLNKNRHRFSSLSYAYRDDRNVHFAIQDIALDFKKSGRVFIAEFDFRKFFDSIEHQYLFDNFDKNAFLVSPRDRQLIKAFLVRQERGIPQGCSISLFLANMVCWELDRRLENEGLRFARYADDTIIWSNSYDKICRSFEIIREFSSEAGVTIHTEKSNGISLMGPPGIPLELNSSKSFIEFLGYKIGTEHVGIKAASVEKIKDKISYILYRNLLQPVKAKKLRALTVPANNRDAAFVTAVMQIRRYLYGSLTESKLRLFLRGKYKRLSYKGIMSFYPLINDEAQLQELDKWLIRAILNTLKKRQKLFLRHGHNVAGFPFSLMFESIIDRCARRLISGVKGRVRIPSFLRIYKAINRGISEHGIESTISGVRVDYDY